jgi:hypothetical protein
MARERVQVQGIGDVAPGIQPTIQRGGQYAVTVQRAGRNKLMDLADALGEVNPILQQYGAIAEQEAEIFEEELAAKSPEEVQAMLKQTEGELDKQVRRGTLGWLTSPLNQKRKLKAVGALMHDEYERELKSRVENPANADANIDDLINESKDTLRQKYDSLGSVFVNDGFEGAIRDTTRRYTLAHDSLSTAQSREELKRAGKSVLYRATLLTEDGSISDINGINDWWSENEGSLTPAELFKLRDDVALTHAARGDKEAALAWIDYASGHLKAGTTKMGRDPDDPDSDVFGVYGAEEALLRQRVEELSDKADANDKGDAALLLQEIDAEVSNAAYALNQGEDVYITADGTELKTIEAVQEWAIQKGQDSGNVYAQGSTLFSRIKGAINNVEALPEETKGIALFNTERSIKGGVKSLLEDVASDTLTDEAFSLEQYNERTQQTVRVPNIEYQEIAARLQQKYIDKSVQKAIEISIGSYEIEGEVIRNATADRRITDLTNFNEGFAREYRQELTELLSTQKTKKEARDKIAEDQKEANSYIDPSNSLSEKTSYFFERNNFYDLEEEIKEGNFQEAKSIAKDLNSFRIVVRGGVPYKMNPLKEAVTQLKSTKTSVSDKNIARKKLLLYAIASKGADFYNVENIRKGSVNIEGTEVGIVDKEALQDLALVYPMITKKRLLELTRMETIEAPDILKLYNALFDTDYKDGDKEGEKALSQFILRQKSLYE